MEHPPAGAPDNLTAVFAARVRALRTQARLSGSALAAALKGQGVPWTRTTVAKLETGRRELVALREWFALAVVLDVPPVWLLVDPSSDTPVRVSEGVELDPWTAILWITGLQPLNGPRGKAHDAVFILATYSRLLEHYRLLRKTFGVGMPSPANPNGTTRAVDYATTLQSIANQLREIRDLGGLSVPQVPPDVREHAAELGIELPGQGADQ